VGQTVSRQIPLPKGEGGPTGRVRGEEIFFTAHPPLRVNRSLPGIFPSSSSSTVTNGCSSTLESASDGKDGATEV
jgi:hypothetical protein